MNPGPSSPLRWLLVACAPLPIATLLILAFIPPAFSQQGVAPAKKAVEVESVDAGDKYTCKGRDYFLTRNLGWLVVRVDAAAKIDLAPLLADYDVQQNRHVDTEEWYYLKAKPARLADLRSGARSLRAEVAEARKALKIESVDPQFVDETGRPAIVTGEVIYRLAADTDAKAFFAGEWESVRPLVGTTDQFILRTKNQSADSIFARVLKDGGDARLQWAAPNFLRSIQFHTSDPNYFDQWHLHNTGQSGGTAGADINAEQAWQLEAGGSSNVTIAVLDQGVQLDHPDLQIATNIAELNGTSGVDDDGNGYVDDVHGVRFGLSSGYTPNGGPDNAYANHGTAVAGMAAAHGQNSIGVAGSAYNCKVLPVGLGDSGPNGVEITDDQFAAAILYAGDNADILNISLGNVPQLPVIENALSTVTRLKRGGKGCPTFVSSGNDGAHYVHVEVYLDAGSHSFTFNANLSGGAIYVDNVSIPGYAMQGFEGTQWPPLPWDPVAQVGWDPAPFAGWTRYTANTQNIKQGIACAQISGSTGGNMVFKTPSTFPGGAMSFDVLIVGLQNISIVHEYGLAILEDSNVEIWPVFQNGGAIRYEGRGDNGGSYGISYPASHPGVIAVGASNDLDQVAGYSSAGPGLEFVAPSGDKQYTLTVRRTGVATTDRTGADGYVGGDYMQTSDNLAGTSFSSPLTAGVGALLLSHDVELSCIETRALLRAGCDKIGGVSYSGAAPFGAGGYHYDYGYGRINAAKSLAHLDRAFAYPNIPNAFAAWDGSTRNQFFPTIGGYSLGTFGAFNWQGFDHITPLFQRIQGNGNIVVRVDNVDGAGAQDSAGAYITDFSSGGRFAYVGVKRDGGIVFARRNASSGAPTYTHYLPSIKAPYWTRLSLSGSTISASASPDGVSWTATGSVTLSAATQRYFGLLAVNMDNVNPKRVSAVFDQVSVQGPLVINTRAGGAAGFSGDGGGTILFNAPEGMALDLANNLYIADTGNHRIRRLAYNTTASTVAGSGFQGYGGDGGQATLASLNNPRDVCVDSVGNLYIADSGNFCVRKVTAATGIISTIYVGSNPVGVAVDADDNLYIADAGANRIKRIDSETGALTTFAGGGSSLGDGGVATSAKIVAPSDVVTDAQGNVYIADAGQYRIRRVDVATRVITTVAGTGVAGFSGNGGAATAAKIGTVNGLAVDYAGNLYFTDVLDASNHRVRQIASPTGIISSWAGVGLSGFAGDGAAATAAKLNNPDGVVVSVDGKVTISDRSNNRIRTVK